MNKELKQEAEKHKQEYSFFTKETQNQKRLSFIAGATSKYVEKQKLEFAIEQLKQIESHYKGSAFGMIESKIKLI